jgi:GntR family transcriptional regulator, phosphonate transport system regulatory protein
MARTSLWADIAETLRADIGAGHFGPGDKLPSESDMARRFGVNRHTLRRALAALQDQGLTRSRRGAGVFVANAPTDYPLGHRVRFHQALAAAGRVPGREINALLTRACDATEAEALDLTQGDPVHVCEGRSLADGRPIALFRSLFPAVRLPDLPATLVREASITRALALNGVPDHIRANTRLTAVAATATQALHLELSEGDPLLRSVAINCDPDGHPIEYGTTWFAGDRVTLTVPGKSPES